VALSVLTGEGMPDLMSAILARLAEVEHRVEILLPHAAFSLHGEIRAKATVLSEIYTEAGCLLEVQVSPALLGRLLAEGARVAQPGDRPDRDVDQPPDEGSSPKPPAAAS
jgi:50S ribosomal subunit-associated GTPase HflX